MLIPTPFPNSISSVLHHGDLAIPDLDWMAATPSLTLTTGAGTLPAMFTTISGKGFQNVLSHYLPNVPSSSQIRGAHLSSLEAGIIRDINQVVSSGKPFQKNVLLPYIAVGIHFWGGNSGRNAFIRGNGFLDNCPMDDYAAMAEALVFNPAGMLPPNGNWQTVYKCARRFTNIGVSFGTKHISFWSRATASGVRLPILDSVIYKNFISPSGLPQWQHYIPFLQDFEQDRKALSARPKLAGITLDQMERQLFNWMNTPEARAWHR